METYVLKKAGIEAFEGTEKSHYLNPQARRINRSLGDLTGLTGFGFHLIEVNPGDDTTELHKYYHKDECVYVLEGEAQTTLGQEVVNLGPRDFVGYRAGGLPHKLTNSGTLVLKCIVVGQRLDHDVAAYPDINKRLHRNPEMPWNLVDIGNVSESQAGRK